MPTRNSQKRVPHRYRTCPMFAPTSLRAELLECALPVGHSVRSLTSCWSFAPTCGFGIPWDRNGRADRQAAATPHVLFKMEPCERRRPRAPAGSRCPRRPAVTRCVRVQVDEVLGRDQASERRGRHGPPLHLVLLMPAQDDSASVSRLAAVSEREDAVHEDVLHPDCELVRLVGGSTLSIGARVRVLVQRVCLLSQPRREVVAEPASRCTRRSSR